MNRFGLASSVAMVLVVLLLAPGLAADTGIKVRLSHEASQAIWPTQLHKNNATIRHICGIAEATCPISDNAILDLASPRLRSMFQTVTRASALSRTPPLLQLQGLNNAGACLTNGVSAVMFDDARAVIVDSAFLERIAASDWAKKFVLAHELGHHVEGHTLTGGSTHQKEYEADAFAARVLVRMGASLEQTLRGIQGLPIETAPSVTHPRRADRMRRVKDVYTAEMERKRIDDEQKNPFAPMTWSFSVRCNSVRYVQFAFFDRNTREEYSYRTSNTSPQHWRVQNGESGSISIQCRKGHLVCFGGGGRGSDVSWGVGLGNSKSCEDCCQPCGGNQSFKVSCR